MLLIQLLRRASPRIVPFLTVLAMLAGPTGLGRATGPAGLIDLAATGQTTSYATGDDGDWQQGVVSPEPRFVDNGDGTITDALTGLIWTKSASLGNSAMTWSSGLSYANALGGGMDGLTDGSVAGDWRLPNVRELQSLTDYSNYDPCLENGHPFVSVPVAYYWTSSTDINRPTDAWSVYLRSGWGGQLAKSSTAYVWAVRDGMVGEVSLARTGQTASNATGDDGDLQRGVASPQPRFFDNGDGTITDDLTGLVWSQKASLGDATMSWPNALIYVNQLSSGTQGLSDGSVAGDWHLPNVRELQSLTDYSNYSPSLESGHPFVGVQMSNYWASSTDSSNQTGAWAVSMVSGWTGSLSKTNNRHVWAVRPVPEPAAQGPVALGVLALLRLWRRERALPASKSGPVGSLLRYIAKLQSVHEPNHWS